MLQIEPASPQVRVSQQVAIAGYVIDAFTKRTLPGAMVRIVEAPEAFYRRLVIPARQVWLGAPPQLDDPQAALDKARSVLANILSRLQDRVAAARVVFNNPLATRADEFLAAQAVLDYQDSRLVAAAKRPDQTRTATDGSFFFMRSPDGDGDYVLHAWLPGAGSRYKDFKDPNPVTVPSQTVPIPMVPMPLSPTGLRGRIVDAASTSGIEMAEVRVEGSGELTFSGSDLDPQKSGAYQLLGVEKGACRVRASAQGYESETLDVVLDYGVVKPDQDIPLAKK